MKQQHKTAEMVTMTQRSLQTVTAMKKTRNMTVKDQQECDFLLNMRNDGFRNSDQEHTYSVPPHPRVPQ